MSDPELELLRQQRLAQLQAQAGGGGVGGGGGSANNPQNKKSQEDQARAQEDAKNSILVQILDQQARARLNTLMLGKPEKGKMVESMLIRMAQTGQIRGKIGENELISLLENVNQQMAASKTTTVKFDRRRAALDSDDDL